MIESPADQKPLNISPSHELRLRGVKKRLLLCPVQSDNKRATLYVATHYLAEGLHNSEDQRSLLQKKKTVTLSCKNTDLDVTKAAQPATH